MGSFVPTAGTIVRQWHVIDADGQVLGRVATEAARLLQGKHKPVYTPHIDTGDHVVIVNAARVVMTGRKEEQKLYRYHSGYEGGLREERAKDVRTEESRPPGGRSRPRHAPEDDARRSDVAQAQGLRRCQASAPGAAAAQLRGDERAWEESQKGQGQVEQARGRLTWQQGFSTTARAAARHRPPACSFAPAPGASSSTASRSSRPSPPKRCARRSSSRWR